MIFKIEQNSTAQRLFLGEFDWRTGKRDGEISIKEFVEKFPHLVVTTENVTTDIPKWGWGFYNEDRKLVAENWDTSG